MTILLITLTLLFISPAFYRLKSKGYPTAPFILSTIGVFVISSSVGFYCHNPFGGLIACLAPIFLLGLSFILKTRKGSLGSNYLTIKFPCPECNELVSFHRESEGRAELCPICGELLSVPVSQTEPTPSSRIYGITELESTSDFVTVGKFLIHHQAESVRERLASQGIPAILPDSTISHVHPGLGLASGGERVLVPRQYASQAMEVLNAPEEERCLPHDFVPPPAPPEPAINGRLAVLAFYNIVLLILLPAIMVPMWSLIVPIFFHTAVHSGVINRSISYTQALQITAVISLTFVTIAFFLESGHNQKLQRNKHQPKSDA